MKKINLVLWLTILMFGCKNELKKTLPDVSDIKVNTNIVRFDQMLMQLDTNNIEKSYQDLVKKEPVFTDFYFKYLMRIYKKGIDESFYKELKTFLGYASVQDVAKSVDAKYKNFDSFKSEFDEAFKYYKYYFAKDTVPNVYTFFTQYTYAAIIPAFNNGVGIGLDMFLGNDYKEYTNPQLNFPEYLIHTFDKKYVVSRTISAVVEDKMGIPNGNRLLDLMIFNGKKMYIQNQLLPNVKDSILHEYTSKQMQWCNENEAKIWAHLTKENLLYSTQMNDIQKLINISPNSPGMPQEAPGRTANFIGMKIVEQFMNRNPKTTIKELIQMKDAQKLLELAKYKP